MFLGGHGFNILIHKYFSEEWEQIYQFSLKRKRTEGNSPLVDTFFWHRLGDKTYYGFLVTSGVYFLEKYDGLSELVAFAQNWSIWKTRIDQRGDH